MPNGFFLGGLAEGVQRERENQFRKKQLDIQNRQIQLGEDRLAQQQEQFKAEIDLKTRKGQREALKGLQGDIKAMTDSLIADIEKPGSTVNEAQLQKRMKAIQAVSETAQRLGVSAGVAVPDLAQMSANRISGAVQFRDKAAAEAAKKAGDTQAALDVQNKPENVQAAAARAGAIEAAKQKVRTQASGMFSAVTKILADGSTIQAGPSGRVDVRGPAGEVVEGEERLAVLKAAQQAELRQARAGAASKAAGTQAVKMSGEAIEKIGKIKTSIANMDEAIRLIDEGAQTGVIMSRLPSVRSASVALDNVQKSMGLDVVGATTFGALSKGELDLALSKALPTGLSPEALKEWLQEKRSAQEKLAGYLENAAIYLGIPGNTAAGWIQEQKDLRQQLSVDPSSLTDDELLTFDGRGQSDAIRQSIVDEIKKRGL